MAGFIRLSRKYFEHSYWTEKRTFSAAEAWLDLIASARFEIDPGTVHIKMKIIQINRGELPASVRFLARRWSWSKDKVARYLNNLENDTMISRETRQGETVITILNYNKFNPLSIEFCDTGDDSNKDANRTLTRTEVRTEVRTEAGQIKEYKEEKKEESLSAQREKFYFPVLEIFYFRNLKTPVRVANDFFTHYEKTGWRDKNGNLIRDVLAAARQWEDFKSKEPNCPVELLKKWQLVYFMIKNEKDSGKILTIRPKRFIDKTLFIGGKERHIQEIGLNDNLMDSLRSSIITVFGKIQIQVEPDNMNAINDESLVQLGTQV